MWQGRLQQLLLDRPDLAGELRRLLENTLAPALSPVQHNGINNIAIYGGVRGSTFNVVNGNQTNIGQS